MVNGERRVGQGGHHLSRLVLIADRFTDQRIAARAEGAVAAGVPWVHLRDHDAAPADFRAMAERLAAALRPEARVTVNARLEVAQSLSADFHTGARGLRIEDARAALGSHAQIGYSAHMLDEARAAFEAGADYILFSPVFPTSSKPGHPGAGLDALRACCIATPGPVFALGGVMPERVAACLDAGAHGVAVLSGILRADDPGAAAEVYLRALVRGSVQ